MNTQAILGAFAGYGPVNPENYRGAPVEAPVKVGDTVRFIPAAFHTGTAGFGGDLRIEVQATVIFVHQDHRYYRAEWTMSPGCTGQECFKF